MGESGSGAEAHGFFSNGSLTSLLFLTQDDICKREVIPIQVRAPCFPVNRTELGRKLGYFTASAGA